MRVLVLGALLGASIIFFLLRFDKNNSPSEYGGERHSLRTLTSTTTEKEEIAKLREQLQKVSSEAAETQAKWSQEIKNCKEQELTWKKHEKLVTQSTEEYHDQIRILNQTLMVCTAKLAQVSAKLSNQQSLEDQISQLKDQSAKQQSLDGILSDQKAKYEKKLEDQKSDYELMLADQKSLYEKMLADQRSKIQDESPVEQTNQSDQDETQKDESSEYLNKFSSKRRSPSNRMLILDGEWESPIWGESLNQSKKINPELIQIGEDGSLIISRARFSLQTEPFFDDLSLDVKEKRIVGLSFSFERILVTGGVFRFAILFANSDNEYVINSRSLYISCDGHLQTCDVSRAHQSHTFWRERRVKVFNFPQPSEHDQIDISLVIRKIGCDFYLLTRTGPTQVQDSFMLNNLEFCSNDFVVKVFSDNPVLLQLSPLRVSEYHGSCSIPTVCQCYSGWTGDECNIPGESRYDDEYEKKMKDLIHRLQYPPDCKTTRALVFSWKQHGLGFGNSMHWMLAAFTWSIKNNRTFLLADKDTWQYVDPKACPEQSYHCYFLPLSNCSVASLGDQKEIRLLDTSLNERVLHTWVPHLYLEKQYYNTNPLLKRKEEMDVVPEEFQNKGVIWWYSQLLAHAWRLNEKVTKILEDFKLNINLPNEYFGMHVRRGDKIAETPNSPPEWYMETIQEFNNYRSSLPPILSIFLATDDPGIIKDFVGNKKYNWYYDHEEKRMNGTTLALWEGRANGTEQTLTIIKNIEIISKAQNFVSTWSSNFGRMILELKVGRGGTGSFAPASSTDLPFWDPLGKVAQW